MIILCPSTVKGFQNREWEERKKDCLWSENVPGHHRVLLIKQAKASSVASENPRSGPWATLASTCRKSTTVWKQGLLNPGKHSLTLNLAYLNKTSPWRQNTFWSSFINQESFLYLDSSCLVATDWCVFAIFFPFGHHQESDECPPLPGFRECFWNFSWWPFKSSSQTRAKEVLHVNKTDEIKHCLKNVLKVLNLVQIILAT